jgi:GPH family glycoside/pentoside/hexuronide:cation symporter
MNHLSLRALLCYGLFGLPLAMVALPIYVYLPQFYAERTGMSLAAIGLALLAARILAAFVDPLMGSWIARAGAGYPRFVALAIAPLLAGFALLFHPPALSGMAALVWFLATLSLVYLGFSLATIAHQSWGAALTQAPAQRARVTGVREGCGLLGVLLAAGVTGAAGYGALSVTFAIALLSCAALLLAFAARPVRAGASARSAQHIGATAGAASGPAADPGTDALAPLGWRALAAPLREAPFRALFGVLLVNGVASAIPATLFLFFATDRLQLGPRAPLFLLLYFGAAAVSMPLWVGLAQRFGEVRAWGGGMLASALIFVWAYALDPGAALAFGAICTLSGLMLGAELALPPALLAGVIGAAGHAGQREAAYFGLWNWGVQMTLALAAGVSLPLLGWLGYVPGQGAGVAAQGSGALAAAYALLPCALKLLAAALLYRAPLRHT